MIACFSGLGFRFSAGRFLLNRLSVELTLFVGIREWRQSSF